ncbi:MAG: transposase [Desulfovibrio sp.]|jgi:IS5 family transposase|nr:transposase [Desulfovibrio sp.]
MLPMDFRSYFTILLKIPFLRKTKLIENEWHFGMKCHLGVDAGGGYVHSLETTSANISDMEAAANLLRKDDAAVLWRCRVYRH